MIKIQHEIPRAVTVACSGGVDSIAIVDFLSRNHDVKVAYFDHCGDRNMELFVQQFCARRNLRLTMGRNMAQRDPSLSLEEFWRIERYKFFHRLKGPVITCHHLDDCIETWLWSSMHGTGKIIPYANGNVIRPFRTTPKQALIDWCNRHDITWFVDPSNTDESIMRNYIRRKLMPHVLVVNPGIAKVISKKITSEVI